MVNKFIYIIICCSFVNCLSAESKLLFKPLTANPLEARIGAFYQVDVERLRLDIGHSLDMLHIYDNIWQNGNSIIINAGGDFFILSRLRSDGRFKFPVETADYYFGLNTTMKLNICNEDFGVRLRVGHISSHLIDGYTNDDSDFLQEPFVYSREFIDLVCAYSYKVGNIDLFRIYLGLNTVFSTLPKDVAQFVPQAGFDLELPLFFDRLSITGGYDGKLVGRDEKVSDDLCNAAQVGLSYYLSKYVAIELNYYYHNGYSIHGMFYDKQEKYHGIGIQITY